MTNPPETRNNNIDTINDAMKLICIIKSRINNPSEAVAEMAAFAFVSLLL